MFSRMEDQRLSYIRFHQDQIRGRVAASDSKENKDDENDAAIDAAVAAHADDNGDSKERERTSTYLPAGFANSARNKKEHVADAYAIAAALGDPQFFITATANPRFIDTFIHKDSEAKDNNRENITNESYLYRPDLIVRAFQFFVLFC